ncbi:MAG: type I-C CRISPR-associated protein Cas8c/Csd1 [Clostridia bacterium]|nr:type I-C CRISPR-associated protein Cas8c/Csd1 [Clostridia bacterium]
MILEALVRHYDDLLGNGDLERPGWQGVKVSFALDIDDAGNLLRVISLMIPVMRGKKEALSPQTFYLPEQVKRASNVAANLFCDNSGYILGIDNKGKPERTLNCFNDCKSLHERVLKNVNHPVARAIIAFFENWRPENAREHEAIKPYLDEILSGGNLIFYYRGDYAQDISELQRAWDDEYSAQGDGDEMQCLVTGRRDKIAILHPNIKGVQGAQPTGASVVSFNAPAYESYGRDGGQGLNAPVSKRAAFAYGAALNYLLSDDKHRVRLGDTTVVFWAEGAQVAYADSFAALLGESDQVDDNQLRDVMNKISNGLNANWGNIALDPSNRFYILGLAPNAARLSVRFFLGNTFGSFVKNMRRHHDDLEIIKPSFDKRSMLSLWMLLYETVNTNSRDKAPSPLLAGELTRAVLTGATYPVLLYTQVQLRIRAQREITRGRAAIIKAYLLRNTQGQYADYKEALTVELNENTTYPPYLLGRLFSILEAIQEAANPDINATIRDRYFNSACATPAAVFPLLVKLAQSHLKKLTPQGKVYFGKQLTQIECMFDHSYPRRLNLHDQGIFQLGYYHQVQKRYQKKEDKENG